MLQRSTRTVAQSFLHSPHRAAPAADCEGLLLGTSHRPEARVASAALQHSQRLSAAECRTPCRSSAPASFSAVSLSDAIPACLSKACTLNFKVQSRRPAGQGHASALCVTSCHHRLDKIGSLEAKHLAERSQTVLCALRCCIFR